MLDNTSKWSHARGNTVVPSRWQAIVPLLGARSGVKMMLRPSG